MQEDPPLIAFATMVRNEPLFLPRWIRHYAAHVPKSHLFILFDGHDQPVPPEAEGCQQIFLPRAAPAPGWDHRRWAMLSDFAAMLLGRFDVVVLNDVDELLVSDPAGGKGLLAVIDQARDCDVLTPFALEVVHRTDLEPAPLDASRPILGQRGHVRINASYCKPCIISRPVRWSVGGHYSSHERLTLDPQLYLFHFRFCDRDLLLARQAERAAHLAAAERGAQQAAGGGWAQDAEDMSAFLDSFIARGAPIASDFDFGWQIRRIEESWHHDEPAGIWRHATLHNRRTYAIPARFHGLV